MARAQHAPTCPEEGAPPQEVLFFTPWQLSLRRLRRHRLAVASLWILGLLYLATFFAEFLAPYPETLTHRRKFYHPPTPIHFRDQTGRLTWPYIYEYRLVDVARRRYEPDRSRTYPIRLFYRGAPYRFLGLFESNLHLFGVDEPARIFLLGADGRGRDIFSRLLYGGRRSLLVPILGIATAFSLGLLYGGVSGYFGGAVDTVMMRVAEVFMSLPGFYLLIALAGVLPRDLSSTARFTLITVILAFIGWGGLARVIRGQVLSLRERAYVEGARAAGASHLRVIVRHLLPNTLSYTVVAITVSFPGYILGESAISLFGLGIQEPLASWGNMLAEAQNISALQRFPWILWPGFFISLSVLCANLLGDGLRDALDPRGHVGMGPR